jgi:antitoxin component YwqK of YwqJK toxin-antitoxin module
MENFAEVKENIIKQAIKKKACETQLERAKACESWDELKEVIADNILWCNKHITIPDGHYKTSNIEFTIVNGKLEGEYKSWYDNSQLWQECFYKKGKLEGEYKSWHENGQPFGHSFYKDGECEGEFKKWYENGQLWEECFYKKNKRDGEYKEWYGNGRLVEHHIYKDGILIERIK